MRYLRSTAVRVAIAVVVLGILALVILTAMGAFAGGGSTFGATKPATGAAASGSGHRHDYYVSLGDSYAVGYQPSPVPGPTPGYTGVVAKRTHLVLENFGCGGATTTSILDTVGCASPYGPPAGSHRVAYPDRTQAAAAERFIRHHRGRIGLVTVSIGGNDITHCATAPSPIQCATTAVATVQRNVTTLARRLRTAAGPKVPILGLTYPDVLLGLWVYPPDHPDTTLASLSVAAFKGLFNPALAKSYRASGGGLVDVTKDTGAYVPLTTTTTLAPYGQVPEAVARVCMLSWYCTQGNIHLKSAGYDLMGDEVVAAYRASMHG